MPKGKNPLYGTLRGAKNLTMRLLRIDTEASIKAAVAHGDENKLWQLLQSGETIHFSRIREVFAKFRADCSNDDYRRNVDGGIKLHGNYKLIALLAQAGFPFNLNQLGQMLLTQPNISASCLSTLLSIGLRIDPQVFLKNFFEYLDEDNASAEIIRFWLGVGLDLSCFSSFFDDSEFIYSFKEVFYDAYVSYKANATKQSFFKVLALAGADFFSNNRKMDLIKWIDEFHKWKCDRLEREIEQAQEQDRTYQRIERRLECAEKNFEKIQAVIHSLEELFMNSARNDLITITFQAVKEGALEQVKAALLEQSGKDAVLLSQTDEGSLLHLAAASGQLKCVQLLLGEKMFLNAMVSRGARKGNTPLHEAAREGHHEVAAFLLKQGALPRFENAFKQTPVDLARENGHEALALMMEGKVFSSGGDVTDLQSVSTTTAITSTMSTASSLPKMPLTIAPEYLTYSPTTDRIGGGSFGDVYRATLHGTTTVALKVLKGAADSQEKALMSEVKVMAKLRHAHVVALIGIVVMGQKGLVMEFLVGGNLGQFIYGKPKLDTGTQVGFGRQLCAGLDFLHQKKVLHRDLKPDNVLMDSTHKHLKIGDFGLSRETLGSMTAVSTAAAGTISFSAPEVAEGKVYTKACDVFSLGMTLLVLATEEEPYHGMAMVAILLQVAKGGRPDIPDKTDARLSQAIKDCWQQSAENRPSAASIFKLLGGDKIEKMAVDPSGSLPVYADITM